MPRTTTLECPGCPPIRALTFDVLGLVKVVETRDKGGIAKVVDRWGEPDSSRCVLAASIDDSKFDPLVAVARKSGVIEVLNPLNGDLRLSISNSGDGGPHSNDDAIVGLHMFKDHRLLTCTTKGHASIRTIEVSKLPVDPDSDSSSKTLNVCASGTISCTKVDGSEKYALFGGKGVEVNVWDIEGCTKKWTAKSPPTNSLGIFTPTWFTSATFLSKDDHRKFVAGTNNHQIRLYDISSQRRPVLSIDFRETPIKAVAEDLDGYTIYAGNGSGDLGSFDVRTGKLLGCFLGKCSGSIRSIARHPELPVLASCGLDSYLRLWDINSRQLLSAVFLKQHLTSVVFDSNFSDEEVAGSKAVPPTEASNVTEILDEEEILPLKRKKTSKEKSGNKKLKSKVTSNVTEMLDEEEILPVKLKKTSKEKRGNKKLKSKIASNETEMLDEEEILPVKLKKTSKEKSADKKLKSKKKGKTLKDSSSDAS